MISPHIREEIALKQDKIRKGTESGQLLEVQKQKVEKALREMGNIYSFWIEHPELRRAYLLENKSEDTVKKESRESIRALINAGNLLYHNYNGEFMPQLTPDILKRANALINKRAAKTGTYRNIEVTLGFGAIYMPPKIEVVPSLIEEALYSARQVYEKDKLEAAIGLHLDLAFIQPFRDGNKRTARIVQDRILYDAGLPPAIISAGEGKFYLDLIKRTAPAYKERNDEGKVQFFDYIASKVNNGLDEVLKDLK